MAIDLMHVLDANRGRLPSSGPLASAALGRLRQMHGGGGGETNSTGGPPVAGRPGSQSSAIRLRLSGAEALCRSRWNQTRWTSSATLRQLST